MGVEVNPALGHPPPVPTQVQMKDLLPGQSAISDCGGFPKAAGQCSVSIAGDPDGVFSIDSLETLHLVRDPDLPPGLRNWETLDQVSGAGPIQVAPALALDINVRFRCPVNPLKDTYTASAVAVIDADPNPVLRIPITAALLSESLGISISSGPATYSPGQTQQFDFLFDSSFRQDISGVFALAGPNPPFSDPSPISLVLVVPAMGQVTQRLSV